MFAWIKRLTRTLVVSSVATLSACGGGDDHPLNIVETAQSDARFSVLAEAVVAADLGDTLSGPGPFTAQGGIFKIDTVGSDLVITDDRNRKSKIVITDIQTSNGVIHAIEKVLLPRP